MSPAGSTPWYNFEFFGLSALQRFYPPRCWCRLFVQPCWTRRCVGCLEGKWVIVLAEKLVEQAKALQEPRTVIPAAFQPENLQNSLWHILKICRKLAISELCQLQSKVRAWTVSLSGSCWSGQSSSSSSWRENRLKSRQGVAVILPSIARLHGTHIPTTLLFQPRPRQILQKRNLKQIWPWYHYHTKPGWHRECKKVHSIVGQLFALPFVADAKFKKLEIQHWQIVNCLSLSNDFGGGGSVAGYAAVPGRWTFLTAAAPGGKKPLSALLSRKEPTLSSYQLARHLGALCQKMYFKKARDIAKSTMQLCWPRNSGLHYDLCSRVAAAAAAALGTRMVQSKEEQCVAEWTLLYIAELCEALGRTQTSAVNNQQVSQTQAPSFPHHARRSPTMKDEW